MGDVHGADFLTREASQFSPMERRKMRYCMRERAWWRARSTLLGRMWNTMLKQGGSRFKYGKCMHYKQ